MLDNILHGDGLLRISHEGGGGLGLSLIMFIRCKFIHLIGMIGFWWTHLKVENIAQIITLSAIVLSDSSNSSYPSSSPSLIHTWPGAMTLHIPPATLVIIMGILSLLSMSSVREPSHHVSICFFWPRPCSFTHHHSPALSVDYPVVHQPAKLTMACLTWTTWCWPVLKIVLVQIGWPAVLERVNIPFNILFEMEWPVG